MSSLKYDSPTDVSMTEEDLTIYAVQLKIYLWKKQMIITARVSAIK